MSTTMEEHRNEPRHRVLKGAKIVFHNHESIIDCTVRNQSPSGACLEVLNPMGIPDDFDLIFDDHHLTRTCHVVWRRTYRIGVHFRELPQTAH
jgi:hypothetical protein